MPTMSDEQLIAALIRDEPGAYKAYEQAYGTKLFRFLVARTKNLADAEEIHNEVLARVMQTWRVDGGPLKDWLYRIAYQRVVAWARRTAQSRTQVSLDQLLEGGFEPDAVVNEPATEGRLATYKAQLREVAQSLTVAERRLFQLCIVEDMTDEQVAALTGYKATSVKTMRLRMQRKIKEALGLR